MPAVGTALPFLGPWVPSLSVVFTGPGVPIPGCLFTGSWVPIPGCPLHGFLGPDSLAVFLSFHNLSTHRCLTRRCLSTWSSIQILESSGTPGGTTILTSVCSLISTVLSELSAAPWTRAPSSLVLTGVVSSRGLCHLLTLCSSPLLGPLLQHPTVLLISNSMLFILLAVRL